MSQDLTQKKILLGVTGSIAAYKSALLCRLLIKRGAEVRVIMTESAKDFIQPLTLSTLSGQPVVSDIFEEDAWNNHVELGLWADAMIIAPCTANTLAKMAHGICDNLLSAIYLSARCPVFIAPAMDVDMWSHHTTQRNIKQLSEDGCTILGVDNGFLASGLHGEGRMLEPENILTTFLQYLNTSTDSRILADATALVTAGPTYEPIDPVRYIGNWSSGRMGIALAEALASHGTKVHLVCGPSSLHSKHAGISEYRVTTAQQMYDQCKDLWSSCQIGVMSAAVADYRPKMYHEQKVKKFHETELSIELTRTPDIAANLGKSKTDKQILVGFALESENALSNAQQKAAQKNLDFIVLNELNEEGAGFQTLTNRVTFLDKNGVIKEFPLKSKNEVAQDVVSHIIKIIKDANNS